MKRIIITLLYIGVSLSIFAQSEADTLTVDQVEIIKNFDADLTETNPIDIQPTIATTIPSSKSYDYNITVTPLEITYPAPTLRPLAMGADPEKDVDHLYAKLGYGTKNSPFADVSYQLLIDDLLDFNIYGGYQGYKDENEDWNHKTSLLNFGVLGSYRLFDNTQLALASDFNLDEFNTKHSFGGKLLPDQRKTNQISGALAFQSVEPTSYGLQFDIGGSTQLFNVNSKDLYEVNFNAHAHLDKSINNKLSAFIRSDYSVNIDGKKDSVVLQTVNLRPGVSITNPTFTAKIGGEILFNDGELSPFLYTYIGLPILEDRFQVYAGTEQTVEANNFYNRYGDLKLLAIDHIDNIKNTVSKKGYLGIRSQLNKKVAFDVHAGYMDTKNQAGYNIFSFNKSNYIQYYDTRNLYIEADVSFKPTETILVGGNVVQNYVTSKDEIEVFSLNRPTLLFTGYSRIKLLDNALSIDPSLRLGRIHSEADTDVNFGYLDLEARYFPIENVGVWLKADNILDNRTQAIYVSPITGRYIQGGVIFKL